MRRAKARVGMLLAPLLVGVTGRATAAVLLLAILPELVLGVLILAVLALAVLALAVLARPVLAPGIVLCLLVKLCVLTGRPGLVTPRRCALFAGTVSAGTVPPASRRAGVTRQPAVVGVAQPPPPDGLQVGELAIVVRRDTLALPVRHVIAMARSAASRPVRE
jgi:hypothetical protein